MKLVHKLFIVACIIAATMSISSCKDDWDAMVFVAGGDTENISYTPNWYGGQMSIVAPYDAGHIVFTCQNYHNLYLEENGSEIDSFDNGSVAVTIEAGNRVVIDFKEVDEDTPNANQFVILDVKTRQEKRASCFFTIQRPYLYTE